jgi:hypothetical protein
MFILLNGPLGIGKSTLAEALGEAIESCLTLFGDSMAGAELGEMFDVAEPVDVLVRQLLDLLGFPHVDDA